MDVDAVVGIDGIFERHGLGIFHISRFSLGQTHIIGVDDLLGAFVRADTACDAFVFYDKPGMFQDLHREMARFPVDRFDFTQCDDLYIQMPADLDQFGRDNSHGTVVCGEGLVQLGHHAADGGRFFKKVYVIPRVCQIQCGLHAGNSATDNQNRSDNIVGHFYVSPDG